MEMVVVFPAPLGPKRAKNSPGLTVKLMSLTAGWGDWRYFLTKCRTSIAGGVVMTGPLGEKMNMAGGQGFVAFGCPDGNNFFVGVYVGQFRGTVVIGSGGNLDGPTFPAGLHSQG